MKNKLKPCPFCSGKAQYKSGFFADTAEMEIWEKRI